VDPLIEQVSQATGCYLIDVNGATKNMQLNYPDNVHPNDAGAAVIAATIYYALTGLTPAAPTGLNTISGSNSVALSWTASTGATGYNVKRSTTNGGSYTVIATNVAILPFVDSGVVNGTNYYYVVSAINSHGESATNSSQVNAVSGNPYAYWTGAVDGTWTNSLNWTTLPSINNIVLYDTGSTNNLTQTLGQNWSLGGQNWAIGGLRVVNPANNIVFNGTNILNISGGIDMSSAVRNLTLNAPVMLASNQTWTIGGSGVFSNSFSGSIANNDYTTNGRYTLTINNTASGSVQTNVYLFGPINGSGQVVKTGNGTVVLGVLSGYTGGTIINGGAIMHRFGVNGLGAAWSPVGVNSNATWFLNGASVQVGTLTLTNGNCGTNRSGTLNFSNIVSSGSSTIGVGELKIGADQASSSYTAVVNVADGTLAMNIGKLDNSQTTTIGSLVKIGAGTMVVSNITASYKGATTISGGVLQVFFLADGFANSDIGKSSSSAANLILNGGTLRYGGGTASMNRLFSLGINGGTLDASGIGALNLNNVGPVGFVDSGAHLLTLTGTATNTLAASLGDNGGGTALLKTGLGTWTLSGPCSYSGGTTVAGGTLTVSSTGTLGTGDLTVSNGAACIVQNAAVLTNGASVYLNGTMNLAYSGTNTVARLYIGGVQQSSGLWSGASAAGYLSGTGYLQVTGGPAAAPMVLSMGASAGGGLTVTWTNSAASLLYTPSLTPPILWTAITNPAVYSNGWWSVMLSGSTNSCGFYRLQQ
jgi:fibronectin-binding autotransporter adhesin